jgi:hypothetical protein
VEVERKNTYKLDSMIVEIYELFENLNKKFDMNDFLYKKRSPVFEVATISSTGGNCIERNTSRIDVSVIIENFQMEE